MEDVEVRTDPASQRTYYFNRRTSQTGWNIAEVAGVHNTAPPPPPPAAHVAPTTGAAGSHDHHIEERFDESRRQSYFFNKATGQSGWSRQEVGGSHDPAPAASAHVAASPTAASVGTAHDAHIEERFDHSRRQSYFFNKATGQSGWSRQEVGGSHDAAGAGAAGAAATGVAAKITRMTDPATGRTFFVNDATGQTGWSEAEVGGAPSGTAGHGHGHDPHDPTMEQIRAKAELDEHRHAELQAAIGGSRAQAEAWTPVMSAGEEAAAAIARAEEEAALALKRAHEMGEAARLRAEHEAAAALKHAQELSQAARRRAIERAAKARQRAELEVAERRKVEQEAAEARHKAEEAAASVIKRAEEEVAARKRVEESATKALREAEEIAKKVRAAELEVTQRPLEEFTPPGMRDLIGKVGGGTATTEGGEVSAPSGPPPASATLATALEPVAEAEVPPGGDETADAAAADTSAATPSAKEEEAEGAGKGGGEGEGADEAKDTTPSGPKLGDDAQAFCESKKLSAGGYDLLAKARESMQVEITKVEELALLEEEDLADQLGMKRIKRRNFKQEVSDSANFPRIDFGDVDVTAWQTLFAHEAIIGGAELDVEAVTGQISAAFDKPAEAGETISQQAEGEDSKRLLVFNGLKDAGLSGIQALRVLGALKAQGLCQA